MGDSEARRCLGFRVRRISAERREGIRSFGGEVSGFRGLADLQGERDEEDGFQRMRRGVNPSVTKDLYFYKFKLATLEENCSNQYASISLHVVLLSESIRNHLLSAIKQLQLHKHFGVNQSLSYSKGSVFPQTVKPKKKRRKCPHETEL